MPGAGLAHGPPATKNAGGSHHRFSRTSGIPRAMVLTFIRVLLGAPGFLATVATRIISRRLSISVGMPGPHDFTSASLAFVSRKPNVHRIPASRVVTIARNAPLNEAGWRHTITISDKAKEIYFSNQG
jgi:hypothetical protein